MKALVLSHIVGGLLLLGGADLLEAADQSTAGVPQELVLGWQFSGLDKVLADPGAAKLRQIWALPASKDLKNRLFDQMALVPFQTLSNALPKGAPTGSSLIRPLLEDLATAESYADWRGAAGQPTELVVALQVSDARARLWSTNLWQVLSGWKLGTLAGARSETGDGWTFKHRDGRSCLAFSRTGQWIVLGWGPASLPQHGQITKRIKAEGRPGGKPSGHWLLADVSLERLKPWLKPLQSYQHPPVARVAVSNQADNVRSVVVFQFPRGHGWQPEAWSIPKALMHDPIGSFTAARGIAPILQPLKSLHQLGFERMPNQAFFWANTNLALMTQMALCMSNAGPQVSRIGSNLTPVLFSGGLVRQAGTIAWDTNHHVLLWRGLPLATPQLGAFKDRSGEYLVGGLFPALRSTNSLPPDLFAQFEGRKDLVYYNWEFTEQRVIQWRPVYQLLDMVTQRSFAPTNAPSQRWLFSAAPLLGYSVTEVSASSPTELTLVRKSRCGFTGFELVTLLRWLDSPVFPELNLLGKPMAVKPVRSSKPKPK